MNWWVGVLIVGWIGCGVLAYGLTLGCFTKMFPYMKHLNIVCFTLFAGPIGLLATLLTFQGDGYAWRWKPTRYEERLGLFLKEFETLGKEYFDARYK